MLKDFIKESEQKFDEKFPRNQMGGIGYTYRDGGVKDRENLKSFLTSELLRLLDVVEGEAKKLQEDGLNVQIEGDYYINFRDLEQIISKIRE